MCHRLSVLPELFDTNLDFWMLVLKRIDTRFAVDVYSVDLAPAPWYVLKVAHDSDGDDILVDIVTRFETLDLLIDVVFDEAVRGSRSVHVIHIFADVACDSLSSMSVSSWSSASLALVVVSTSFSSCCHP